MVISKSTSRMDYWREYFGSANASIFEIIERAIVLAASDFPKEFKTRRDGIAQILFSSKLIKCSGCNKEELALPVDNHQEHHDHDGGDDEGVKFKSTNLANYGNRNKENSKVISSSRIDDDHHVELNEMNHQVSKYSYGDAEALTDAIEQESQMFDEVLRIKEIVDNSRYESVSDLFNSLRKLQYMALSIETLKATKIGKSVNGLRRHPSKDISETASSLIDAWKSMVDEYMNGAEKPDGSEATPESINPSVVDEEEGLPSPPLDDFEFLNSHSMPLVLSEKFFDGMDDNGNPRKSGESNKTHDSGAKPPVEKQNVTILKQQKPSNGPTTVLKKDRDSVLTKLAKPTKPPVAQSALGRPAKPNMDRKLQNPEKPNLPKKPLMPPQQRKPRPSNEETVQDKLEATKRKLHERYKEAEKAKRQRTIQVMELHDLPKQSQHMRPGNNHNRNWARGRY